MKSRFFLLSTLVVITGLFYQESFAQTAQVDSSIRRFKNVVRYNLSGALLFGADKNIVLGYERMITPKNSISLNVGQAALPKLISVETDSFQTQKENHRKGFNVSVDYRFYLLRENKFNAPHGLYIGPYYSYNHFENEQTWSHNINGGNEIRSNSDFNIHTVGFELGYQLFLGKRITLDLLMVGPGIGFYDYKATFSGTTNLTAKVKEQLLDALQQRLEQKIPGINYVFSDKKIDADGTLKTTNAGYRYIIHIGYAF